MQNEIVYLYLDDIIPNRFQPREVFDEEALKELAISIKEHGVIQPIIVRQVNNKYEIIAGERRYKASTLAGLTKIPAIIKNLDDKESSKIALIENLQRRDLTPIEEARTYQKILELEEGMTQEGLAQTMGKTQSAISNKLRLLSLPEEVQYALLNEQIAERHARCLLNLEDKNQQIKLLEKVISTRMTVKELEKEIKMYREQNPNGSFGMEFNTNIPSEPVEEKVIPYTASSVELNPTEVDINKIRENSVDINPTRPAHPSVNELMGTGTEAPSDFQFVPNNTPEPDNNASTDSGNGGMNGMGTNIFGAGAGMGFNNLTSVETVNNPFANATEQAPVNNPVDNNLFGGIPFVTEVPKMDFLTNTQNTQPEVNNVQENNMNPAMGFGGNNTFIPTIPPQGGQNIEINSNSSFGVTEPNGNVINNLLSDIPSMNMGNSSQNSNNFFNGMASANQEPITSAAQISNPMVSEKSSGIPDLMGGGMSIGASQKSNVMDAVIQIRSAVKEIEKFGFTASIEELDITNEYQILIKINK